MCLQTLVPSTILVSSFKTFNVPLHLSAALCEYIWATSIPQIVRDCVNHLAHMFEELDTVHSDRSWQFGVTTVVSDDFSITYFGFWAQRERMVRRLQTDCHWFQTWNVSSVNRQSVGLWVGWSVPTLWGRTFNSCSVSWRQRVTHSHPWPLQNTTKHLKKWTKWPFITKNVLVVDKGGPKWDRLLSKDSINENEWWNKKANFRELFQYFNLKRGCRTCEARMVAQLLVLSKVVGLFPRPGIFLLVVCMFSQRLRGSHRLLPTFHRRACQAHWKL